MALLQPRLSLKVSQRQVLTPGLMQMVSVLALNKLELKEMINAEIVENPVLEELDENVPLLDEVAGREAELERPAEEAAEPKEKDPFDEIDFGSYFQDYLDPGYRTQSNFEQIDKPSFENFLSLPSTLTDHLMWQLGSLNLAPAVRDAAEYLIGNLNEDGYLLASDEELLEGYLRESSGDAVLPERAPANGSVNLAAEAEAPQAAECVPAFAVPVEAQGKPAAEAAENRRNGEAERARSRLAAALEVVRQLDPAGIAAPNLRECLLAQIRVQRHEFELICAEKSDGAEQQSPGPASALAQRLQLFDLAEQIVQSHLNLLQKRDLRELARALGTTVEQAQLAFDFIRTLDPRPGQRYNHSDARLIEPDVAFVKRGDEYVVVMNEEDLPALRLNQGYRKLLTQDGTNKEVKDYVKERYRSALQLMRNIEQRKNTILRTCESIVRRQRDFLEHGVESMKPMMIKEVAEEIGVHPSTVSRAVSNKYVHTSQGVFELRFFFSEGVNGPEGAGTPLMLLKRKVKKLIEDEDPHKPLTDEHIAHLLQQQGIDVTRRTVAKYREDLQIPSTHQRRIRD